MVYVVCKVDVAIGVECGEVVVCDVFDSSDFAFDEWEWEF